MKYLKFLYFVGIISMSSGCVEETTIDFPNESKLALYSFISPQDSVVKAHIYRSANIGSGYRNNTVNSIVKDAKVIISDDESTSELKFQNSSDAYELSSEDFRIVEGKTYLIEVSTAGGDYAYSTCTVPYQNKTLQIEIQKGGLVLLEKNQSKMYSYEYNGHIQWQSSEYDDTALRVMSRLKHTWINMNDIAIDNYIDLMSNDGDNVARGIYNTIFLTGKDSYYYNLKFYIPQYTEDKYEASFWLLNLDQHYFNYHYSLINHSSDDPFQQPVNTYSNVIGGLGVFCAYNSYPITFQIK